MRIRRLAAPGLLSLVMIVAGALPWASGARAATSLESDIPGIALPGPVANGQLGGPIYDVVFSLTGGGPYNATETISLFAYRQGFASFNLGFASAVSYLLILALVIILAVEARVLGRRTT